MDPQRNLAAGRCRADSLGKLTSLLRWKLRHGRKERHLERVAEARARRGEPQPELLTQRPRLLPDLAQIWNAWFLLSSFRGAANLNGLDFSVVDCLDLFEVERPQRMRWVRLLADMENEFRSYLVSVTTKDKATTESQEQASASHPS